MQSKGVFISYRRIDSQSTAGRISDDLKRAFGDDAVFRDIDDIAPGNDFVQALDAALADCGVLLAIIGPAWLEQLKHRGERGDGVVDHVHREIERALSRPIAVIPVLVDGAAMPDEQTLPPSLQALARLQGHVQNDKSWRRDTGMLLTLLAPRIGRVAADPFRREARLPQRLRQLGAVLCSPRALAVEGGVIVLCAVAIGAAHWVGRTAQEQADVAFLMSPESIGGDANDEVQVFKDLRGVLKRALDQPNVEVVPDNIAREDLDRYRLEAKEALLAYRGRQGYARVFIHTTYSLEQPSGTRRLWVTPYLRPANLGQRWKSVDGWRGRAYDGEASRRVAIKVGFELIEFLAAKGLLRLQSDELQQARVSLLNEYRGLLETVQAPCESMVGLLARLRDPAGSREITADAESMRTVLEIACVRPDDGAMAQNRSAATAAAVYGGALGL